MFVTHAQSVPSESHLSSDEEHLALCQPFIVCHRYHLGNDLFWPVTMVMVICMEMMLAPLEDEEADYVGGIKPERWMGGGMATEVIRRVVALQGSMSSYRAWCLNVLISMSASRGHCGSTWSGWLWQCLIMSWTWKVQESWWQWGSCLPNAGNSAALNVYKWVTCISTRYLLSVCFALPVWEKVILLYYIYMSAGVNTELGETLQKWWCSAFSSSHSASFLFCRGRWQVSLTTDLIQTKWQLGEICPSEALPGADKLRESSKLQESLENYLNLPEDNTALNTLRTWAGWPSFIYCQTQQQLLNLLLKKLLREKLDCLHSLAFVSKVREGREDKGEFKLFKLFLLLFHCSIAFMICVFWEYL